MHTYGTRIEKKRNANWKEWKKRNESKGNNKIAVTTIAKYWNECVKFVCSYGWKSINSISINEQMYEWMDAGTVWVHSSNNQITCKYTCLNFRWQWYTNFGHEEKKPCTIKHNTMANVVYSMHA